MSTTVEIPEPMALPERLIVQVTLATGGDVGAVELDAIADLADKDDLTVARHAGGRGLTFVGETTDVGATLATVRSIIDAAGGRTCTDSVALVDLRVCAPEIYEAEAERPDTPELLAATDVAGLLGVSRQRVHQLHNEHPQFPAPYVQLGSGPIWTKPAIEHFAEVWIRKPGRPSRRAS
jgi:hypothetical protein